MSLMPKSLERRFIRHPARVPIRFELDEEGLRDGHDFLRNVSDGGVCFASNRRLPIGFPIRLHIPLLGKEFDLAGNVAWCRGAGRHFEVGVAFDHWQNRFAARMVEQLCRIQEYRDQVERAEGRTLTSEQAAMEWVARYAESFPD